MKTLALISLLLFLTGCTTEWKTDQTLFKYGDEVDMVSGFYEGQSGVIVELIGWCYEDTIPGGVFTRGIMTVSRKYKVGFGDDLVFIYVEVCAKDMKVNGKYK